MTKTKSKLDLEDIRIAKVEPHQISGGVWVDGEVRGHRFCALVSPEHAENREQELNQDSYISKLHMTNDVGMVAANFDRGWTWRPRTKFAKKIVSMLSANLADTVFDGA
jgi:hypothetical protein